MFVIRSARTHFNLARQFLNPLADAIYGDGIVYGTSIDPAALYKRDTTVTVYTGPTAPTYYGIERVALAGGVRPR